MNREIISTLINQCLQFCKNLNFTNISLDSNQKMFESRVYTNRINELRDFLIMIADYIATVPDVESKTFKIKQNFLPCYNIVYDMCNQKPPLQQKVLKEFKHSLSYFIESYIEQSSKSKPFRFSIQNSAQAIKWFNGLWGRYIKFMICISKKVFAYLDRYYLPGMEQTSLYKVGLKILSKNVCHQGNMKYFSSCYFKQLREIRDKKAIQNEDLLRFSEAVTIIDYPDLIANLTSRFMEQTVLYYKTYFKDNQALPSVQYYIKIANFYIFETVLVKMCTCLNFFQNEQVSQEFSDILVKPYTDKFLKSQQHGLRKMFQTKNVDFMKIINDVYAKFQGFEKIRESYYTLLIEQSQHILTSQIKTQENSDSKAISLVDGIYEFYRSHLNLLTLGFNKRDDLFITLNNAIEKVISRQENFPAILFQYCSQARKKNLFQQNKDKITLLFQKISSKDQFVSLYENELFKKITADDIILEREQEFVFYLNQICGSQITHKLIKKLKDFEESPIQEEMKLSLPYNTNFHISILSIHLWQKKFIDQISLNVNMPPPLQNIWRTIQRNYCFKNQKKKLIVLPFQSKLVLEVSFNSRKYLMKCNLIQACIFMYLSGKPYASEEQMILNLLVEKSLLQNTLQTFESVPNLLMKTNLGDYLVNWDFYQTQATIDIVSKIQQSKQMTKAIKQDREILVEAAIVKFIKRSKRATFEQIVMGVNSSIRLFKPQPSFVKSSVQKLMKKGFIEEGQGGLLEYVQ